MAEQYMYSTLYMLLESSYLTTITAYTCTVPLKKFATMAKHQTLSMALGGFGTTRQLELSTPGGVSG